MLIFLVNFRGVYGSSERSNPDTRSTRLSSMNDNFMPLEREQRDSGGNRETAAIGNANEILTGFWLKENVQNVDVARLNMNRLDV